MTDIAALVAELREAAALWSIRLSKETLTYGVGDKLVRAADALDCARRVLALRPAPAAEGWQPRFASEATDPTDWTDQERSFYAEGFNDSQKLRSSRRDGHTLGPAPAEAEGCVPVKRWWLEHVAKCLEGDLPSGRIGDCVFLLRDQIKDMLAAAPSPQTCGG